MRGGSSLAFGRSAILIPGNSCAPQSRAPANKLSEKGSIWGSVKPVFMNFPFQNESFDAVFSHALLEHLSDPGAAIAELRRALKPGGLIGL